MFIKAYLLSHTLKHHGFRCFWLKKISGGLSLSVIPKSSSRGPSARAEEDCCYGHCIPEGISILDPGEEAGLICLHFVAEEGCRWLLSPARVKRKLSGGKAKTNTCQAPSFSELGRTLRNDPGEARLQAKYSLNLNFKPPNSPGKWRVSQCHKEERGSTFEG